MIQRDIYNAGYPAMMATVNPEHLGGGRVSVLQVKLLERRRLTLVCVLSSLGSPSASCKDCWTTWSAIWTPHDAVTDRVTLVDVPKELGAKLQRTKHCSENVVQKPGPGEDVVVAWKHANYNRTFSFTADIRPMTRPVIETTRCVNVVMRMDASEGWFSQLWRREGSSRKTVCAFEWTVAREWVARQIEHILVYLHGTHQHVRGALRYLSIIEKAPQHF